MKHVFYIIFSGFLLFLPVYSAGQAVDHIGILQSLIDRNLAYDSVAPIDSVILWGHQVEPVLEKQGQKELLFRIRQLVVYLHAATGNVKLAVDEARQMYNKAKEIDYDLGIALSCRAIGDAYYCSNMPAEAIESYKEAVNRFTLIASDGACRAMTILKLISELSRVGRLDEAEVYRNMIVDSELVHTDDALRFFASAMDVCYFVRKNQPAQAYKSLKEAEQVYQQVPNVSFRAVLNYVEAQYNAEIGNYDAALDVYDRILKAIVHKATSINYLQIAYEKARILTSMGHKKEACLLYQEIGMITDSIVAPSYAAQINNLRATYKVDRLEIENGAEHNQIFFWSVLSSLFILLFIIYLAWHIKRQNKKLADSKVTLEQSRQVAEKAIQMKSLLLSNMSHEIRTPLNALSGFSTLLVEQELDEDMRQQCNEIIQRNSDLLLKLINDVIDLSNLELGEMKFNFGRHDVVSICRDVIDTVNKVKQTQAEVSFKSSLDTLELYTDDSRLQQLLINLLINATKFTTEGSIILTVEQESEDVALFSVTDTGCGISEEMQGQIFNRFEKLNEKAQGTGLGLSICRLIIEHIGGRIWLDSTYTEGCRFFFTHPVSQPEDRKEEQQ
ncbi:tetratricopeptide repeat-containing sensor histidine kinase [Bacteroides sp.]